MSFLKQRILLTFVLLFSASITLAEENSRLYFELGYLALDSSDEGIFSQKVEGDGASLTVGYDLSNVLAIEGNLVYSSTETDLGNGNKFDPNVVIGSVFARGNLSFENGITVFGLVGASYTKLESADLGTIDLSSLGIPGLGVVNVRTNSVDDTGLSYGVGVDLFGNDNTAVTFKIVEYQGPGNKSDDHYTTAILGVRHYFGIPKFRNRY